MCGQSDNSNMQKSFILALLISLFLVNAPYANGTVMQGGVFENDIKSYSRVIEKGTGRAVPNAKVCIPSQNYTTYTDSNGYFEIKAVINGSTVLSVEKENFRPFSMTVSKNANKRTFVVQIETIAPFDICIDTRLCHLGDNVFSDASANAYQFKGSAIGPEYVRTFFIPAFAANKEQYLVFGSIIGIDTALARGIGQNHINTTFASPPSVYLNGHKIAEIQINGDNQRIRLPKNLIKYNQNNTVMIKAGRNLMQTAYIDYDDFEFINLSIQNADIKGQNIGLR